MVASCKAAPAQERNPHHFEIAQADGIRERMNRFVGAGRVTFDRESVAPSGSREEAEERHACCAHPRDSLGPLEQPLVEIDNLRAIVGRRLRVNREAEDALRVESSVDSVQLSQAADKEARAHEEDQRDRNLGDHEYFGQAETRADAASGGRLLESGSEIQPRCAQRWNQPKQDAGQERKSRGKEEDARIRAEVQRNRSRRPRREPDQNPAPGLRQEEPEASAERSQKPCLGEQLAN